MSFLERFRHAVAIGRLKADAGQEEAARELQALADKLAAWRPAHRFALIRPDPPRGLYLWGDVGRGKSMLMDLFSESAQVRPKRRVHFNAFMGEVHLHLHHERRHGGARDPIAAVARHIARGATLLCFDEFQVGDVADAMILGRLFEQLFARGVVVVATSNNAPDRLYEGGLNRQLFLPFIALLKERMGVVGLNGRVDHRRGLDRAEPRYFTPLGRKADAAMDEAWRVLAGGDGEEASIAVLGRALPIPRAGGGAARFSFDDLCKAALGAADYLALARAYHTVLIDHVPAPPVRDEARRFTLLIDTLYDEGVQLVCSAAAPPEALYPTGDGADAFRRTASRLHEMQSRAYIERAKRQSPS